MLNVCFLSGDISRTGGTERVLSIIANELSKKDDKFNIHILSINNESNSSYFTLNKSIKTERILKSKDVNFKKHYFQVVKGIRQYIKNNNIDILIDVEVIASLFSIPATLFTKTRLIAWEHFDFIYNPIENGDRISCDIKAKQLISVGRLTYQKGFDMLCEIAKEVLKDNPDWKWIILGDGEDKEKLESKIKEYNLQGKLILKGKVSNVEDYYKDSSLYVMTSRFEGLPMTLLEAKSYKLPIVSFNCLTGPSEIVRNNINGFLIETGNVAAMVNKIGILLSDINKREDFSNKSNLDIEKFRLKPIVDKWENILINL